MLTLTIFTDFSFVMLLLFLSASLFFLMAGIRELKSKCMEGLLYLILSLFFMIVHFLFLLNLPIDSSISFQLHSFNLWMWISVVMAPTLITLFILFGIFNFVIDRYRTGLIKLFFGLTLVCYLYMLGTSWAIDVKGIITFLYCLAWFEVELRTSN